MPLYVSADNVAGGDTAAPLGSHADMSSQFANARHLWQSGKLKEAASLYESMIEHYPDIPDPYNNLAVIYAAQGDYKKAQQILERGLNTHAGYAAIYENLTAIYVEMARDSYGKALQFEDKSQHQLKLRALAELSVKQPVQVATVNTPPATVVAVSAKPSPAIIEPTAPMVDVEKAPPTTVENKPPVVATTASVQPAEMTDVSPTAPTIDQSEIVSMLESWAAAWSSQSPEQYISYYESQYHPAGQSRRKWAAQRTDRIKRPQWIRVALSDFVVQPITDKRVRVEVQQRYQSNSYSDNERKEFILIQTDQGWRIVSERNI